MRINLLGGFPGHERKGGGFQTGYGIYATDGACPTLLADGGGGYGILIVVEDKKMAETRTNEVVVLGQMDNTIDHTFESANRVYSQFGACPTIPTCTGGGIQPKIGVEVTGKKERAYRIRKLTPRECFRLMNYTDADFDRASGVNSNSQLYKEAGNAIVKSCLMAIFLQMNIKGLKPWNERTLKERQELVRGRFV